MKARLPLTCAQQKRIHDDMVREYGKVAEKEREDMTRRIIKAMLYILNTEFGWGVKRLTRLFNVFANTSIIQRTILCIGSILIVSLLTKWGCLLSAIIRIAEG